MAGGGGGGGSRAGVPGGGLNGEVPGTKVSPLFYDRGAQCTLLFRYANIIRQVQRRAVSQPVYVTAK